jgi:hypothetical protein
MDKQKLKPLLIPCEWEEWLLKIWRKIFGKKKGGK